MLSWGETRWNLWGLYNEKSRTSNTDALVKKT